MHQLDTYKKILDWKKQAELHAPKLGDPAPNFCLPDLDSGNYIRLSDFREEKPVALIFGSHT